MPQAESVARRGVESIDRRGSETSALSLRARLIEVEAEHLRLQRLVAELLIKNQKLRELLCEQGGNFCRCGEFLPRRWDGAASARLVALIFLVVLILRLHSGVCQLIGLDS
jgi:hypothetical protein